jgi:hypothetical protein
MPCVAFDSSSQSLCDACACAKAHQLPYQISSSHSTAPLELIFLMFGGLRLIRLAIRNTMCLSSMIIVNSHDFISYDTNLLCSIFSLSFNFLLSVGSIKRLFPFNLTRVANTSI